MQCADREGKSITVTERVLQTSIISFRWFCPSTDFSQKKKEPKPKLFGSDNGGLPREGVGLQKVQYVLQNPGKPKLLGGTSREFCRDILGVPRKFENKKVCVQFSSRNFCSLPNTPPPQTFGKKGYKIALQGKRKETTERKRMKEDQGSIFQDRRKHINIHKHPEDP